MSGIERGNARIGALTTDDVVALTKWITEAVDRADHAHRKLHEVVVMALDSAVHICNERREHPTVRTLVDAGKLDAEVARSLPAIKLDMIEGGVQNFVRDVLAQTRCGYPYGQWECTLPLGHGGAHAYDA